MAIDLKGKLTKKYGPLPGWAWVAVVGGGAYLVMRYRAGQASATDTSSTDTTDSSGPGGDIAPGGGVTQNPIRNVYYGIRKCPRGYHKVGHRCVRNRRRAPAPRARRRPLSAPAMRAASSTTLARKPAQRSTPISKVGGAKVH